MAVIISSDLVTAAQDGAVRPLTHARIMYQNLVAPGTVTGTTEQAGFEADAVQEYSTYTRWKPVALPATLTADFGAIKSVDYVFIAVHDLGSAQAAVIVEHSSDGTAWTAVAPERIPGDNSALAFFFDEVLIKYVRVRITSAAFNPYIGVVMAGKALAMQRPIYGGHAPVTLSRQTEIRPTQSEGGQWLGRSVVRRGLATSYAWRHLTAAWYRENFDPFVKRARFQPFGIAWRPETFPNEVAYVWTEGDIAPSNMGVRDLMQVELPVTGYGPEEI